MRSFHSFFCSKSLKPSVYFTLTALRDSDAKFSLKIFYLYLDFTKLQWKTQIHMPEWLQTHLKVFQSLKQLSAFKFKLIKVK